MLKQLENLRFYSRKLSYSQVFDTAYLDLGQHVVEVWPAWKETQAIAELRDGRGGFISVSDDTPELALEALEHACWMAGLGIPIIEET